MSDFDAYSILPGKSSLYSRDEASLKTRITRKITVDIPIVASPMSTVTEFKMALKVAEFGGVGVIHRYMTPGEQATQIQKFRKEAQLALNNGLGYKVGGAIGSNNKDHRVDALIDAGADFLMGDVANGWTDSSLELMKYIRKTYGDDVQVISGNIATSDAADELSRAGVDGFRVGIGSGSVCITRQVAGVGRNQLVAINEIHERRPEIPITSCGGIRYSGDIVKALAFGAESVIIGRLFAACDESPAKRLADGRVIYAGMASYFAEQARVERTGENPDDIFHLTSPEGKEDILEPVGPVRDVLLGRGGSKPLGGLLPGIRTGMSYLGARSIPEFQKVAKWEPA